MLFPDAHVENVILLDNVMPNMVEISLMFWMKTNEFRQMALLSYAVKDSPGEFFVGIEEKRLTITMKSTDNL